MKKEHIIIIFLLLGPILDVTNFLGFPISIFVRGLFLSGITIYLLLQKKDLKLLIPLLLFGITLAIYQFFYLHIGIIQTISAVLKFNYLPVSILFFRNYELKMQKEKILGVILILYIGIYLLSYLFGFSVNIYEKEIGKQGFKGLFSSINEFSAIIIGLLPITTSYLMKIKKYIPMVFLLITSIFCGILTGTKVLMGGILFCIFYLLWQKKDVLFFKQSKKIKMIIILISVVTIFAGGFIFTKTTTYQNMVVQQNFFKVKNIVSYEFINRVVYNDRLTYLNINTKYFLKQNPIKILFGIGIEDTTVKLVEIDIFDILFRYGVLGLSIFIFIIIKSINYHSLDDKSKVVILLLTIIAMTSGHVLIYPAVCIYIAVLTSKNKEKNAR